MAVQEDPESISSVLRPAEWAAKLTLAGVLVAILALLPSRDGLAQNSQDETPQSAAAETTPALLAQPAPAPKSSTVDSQAAEPLPTTRQPTPLPAVQQPPTQARVADAEASDALAVPEDKAAAETANDAVANELSDKAPESDEVAASFLMRCGGCHTVGGGDMKGPDLTKATQWSADDLRVAIAKMKKNAGPMDNKEIEALASLLRDDKLKGRLEAERQRSVASMAASLDAPDAAVGAALFFGAQILRNGGMACSSCHRVGATGGELGPDLTKLKDNLPRVAMLSAFEGTNFAVMKPAYADHPVTKQEALHLAAFFENLDIPVAPAGDAAWLLPLAMASALLITLLIALVFKNRGPAGIRARMVSNAQRDVS